MNHIYPYSYPFNYNNLNTTFSNQYSTTQKYEPYQSYLSDNPYYAKFFKKRIKSDDSLKEPKWI
jgi:hypothetical protein